MDALPEFDLLRPTTLDEALKARAAHPDSRAARRRHRSHGQYPPRHRGAAGADRDEPGRRAARDQGRCERHRDRRLGDARRTRRASRRASSIIRWWRRRRTQIAGPTHRNMGTVGGNLCLDTRCIYYNQSEWWRDANDHCLKTTGTMCHVAPKSRGVCFATFSGDLAPAFLTLGAEVDLAGPDGTPHRAARTRSISALRARTFRSRRRRATASSFSRCGRARSSPRCAPRTRPACARPMTRSASAARSNIRSPAWRSRCKRDGDTLVRSARRLHRHQSAPGAARPAPPNSAAGRWTRRSQGPRRSGARPGHGDEDHLHARPLSPPRRRRAGTAAGDATVRRLTGKGDRRAGRIQRTQTLQRRVRFRRRQCGARAWQQRSPSSIPTAR